MLHQSDEELISMWREAPPSDHRDRILELLFSRHYRRVSLFCLRWTGGREEAQDLAQEIFIKVQRSLDAFQGTSKFTTWLYTVCRNHCINAGMAARSRECVELDEVLSATLSSSDPNPEELAASNRQWEAARSLIEKHLDETERQVLLLHYVEGWPLQAVGRALNLTNASGAKAFIVSGQRKLRAAVERLRGRASKAT